MTDLIDATQRFGGRAESYAASRPAYPDALIAHLIEALGIDAEGVVADLGSGTGILSAPFLERGFHVYGIEPNRDMRLLAESLLGKHDGFHSIDGSAEATTLETDSIDLAVAGQAFHWFDRDGTRREIRRILKPGGACALIWNQRQLDSTPFLTDYERFLRTWGTDYDSVQATYENPEAIGHVLGARFTERTFANHQALDRDGLCGRILSASYIPAPSDSRHADMLLALDEMFERHQQDDCVRIDYHTNVYYARVPG